MQKFSPSFLSAACLMALSAPPAAAADFSFTSSDGSFNHFVFSVPTSPTPDAADGTTFTILGVSTIEDGQYGPLIYDADYTFFSDADAGGFENGFVAYYSAQLFGGTTTSPIFYNGTFSLSDFGRGPAVGTLVISNAADAPIDAVPEPATWATMLTGFGIVGGAMRRRKVAVSFA